jgi:bla regulator protein BlaR1
MTITWMAYVLLVSALLSAGAYAAERAFRARKRATRWIWASAIAASVAIPLVVSSVTVEIPRIGRAPEAAPMVIPLRSVMSPALAPAQWVNDIGGTEGSLPRADSFLLNAWPYTSGALIAGLFVSCVLLALRRRRWRTAEVLGEHVYIAQGLGPAVVGFLSPRIVLPPWVLDSPPATQAMVLAHEQQHIAARDPQLLAAALLVLVIMPWNLPLWWQLRRLRHAIEVDCDGRVLAQGRDAVMYGECLLDVGTRLSNSPAAVAAMSESHSLLEQRIRIMMTVPQSWRRASMLAALASSVAFVAVAAQVSPPNSTEGAATPVSAAAPANPAAAAPKAVKLDPAIYDRYVGYYKAAGSEYSVLDVKREGDRLMWGATGQGSVEIFPLSEREFFLDPALRGANNVRIEFVTNGGSKATSVIIKQGNGMEIPCPRIEEREAKRMADALALRIQTNTPHPATEPALRRLIEGAMADKLDYETMSPAMAQAMKAQGAAVHASMKYLGKLQSVEFVSVGPQGWDAYTVKFEKGTQNWRIVMDESGKIAGLLNLPSP